MFLDLNLELPDKFLEVINRALDTLKINPGFKVVEEVSLFGSCARGDYNEEESDVDLIVLIKSDDMKSDLDILYNSDYSGYETMEYNGEPELHIVFRNYDNFYNKNLDSNDCIFERFVSEDKKILYKRG